MGVALLALTAVTPIASASGAFEPSFPAAPLGLTAPGVTSEFAPGSVVAANHRGDAVAAWTVGKHGPLNNNDELTEVQVAYRSGADATGAWSAPQTISASDWRGRRPRVGIDDSGVATIAWVEVGAAPSSSSRIRAVTLGGSGLGPVQDVAPAGVDPWTVSLAVAPGGQAVLAYVHGGSVPGASEVLAHQRSASGGVFGAAQVLSSATSDVISSDPTVSINAGADAAVAWGEGVFQPSSATSRTIRIAQSTAAGVFGAAADVAAADLSTSPGASVWNANVIVDRSGTATVVWDEGSDPQREGSFSIVARRVDVGGVMAPPQVVAPGLRGDLTAQSGARASLGVDAGGRVTAAWSTGVLAKGDVPSPIQVASAPVGGAFAPPITLTERSGGGVPDVAVDPSGTTAVSWGGDAIPAKVAWRPAGSEAFLPSLTPTPSWVRSVDGAFGRPDELTLALDVDLAPLYVVKATTSVLTVRPVAAPAPDTTKPVIAVGKIETVKAPRKNGKKQADRLTLALTASEPVTVRVVVSQRRSGVQKGKQCVKRPSNPKKRKGLKSCARTVVVGPEVGAPVAVAGTTLDLGKAPARGPYTLTVKGTDAAGNVADPVTTTFKVR